MGGKKGGAILTSVKKAVVEGGKRMGERPYLIDRWSTGLLGSINTKFSLLGLPPRTLLLKIQNNLKVEVIAPEKFCFVARLFSCLLLFFFLEDFIFALKFV